MSGLSFNEYSTDAKRPAQAEENVAAADLPALAEETTTRIRAIYDRLVRPQVHHYW